MKKKLLSPKGYRFYSQHIT